MMQAFLVATLVTISSGLPARSRSAPPAKLEVGQREFNRGDFQDALKALDAAATEAADAPTLARIHLLRGQCFAAQQSFAQAEEAFVLALENDAEATLDPSRVDPALVRLLDGVRARLSGTLVVKVDKPDATVRVDGRPAGTAPVRLSLGIGRHRVEAVTADGKFGGELEVFVRARKDTVVDVALPEVKAVSALGGPDAPSHGMRPVADVRMVVPPFQLGEGVGIELGGGVEWPTARASFHAQLYPVFGLAPRGAFLVPITPSLRALVEAELPLLFLDRLAFGLGGAGGIEYQPTKWVGAFVEVGARHFFIGPGGYNNRVVLQGGARLRLP